LKIDSYSSRDVHMPVTAEINWRSVLKKIFDVPVGPPCFVQFFGRPRCIVEIQVVKIVKLGHGVLILIPTFQFYC